MKYLYGPVRSRRLGRSLGITLTPFKFCNLDCVYCQLGPTKQRIQERGEYIDKEEILAELRQFFEKGIKLDFVTFSGFGEPTLHSGLSEIIENVKKISPVKVALITNSVLLTSEAVRKQVLAVDLIVPSLDAASQSVFEAIDRPSEGIKVTDIIDGLVFLRESFKNEIWLEIMLVKGFNDSEKELKLLKQAVLKINPDKIQLNSPIRMPGNVKLEPVDKQELLKIKEFFGTKAEII